MERRIPKDRTLVEIGARTLGSFTPGHQVDIYEKGSPKSPSQRRLTIEGAIVFSVEEKQKGNPSVRIGVPLDSPFGFAGEYEVLSLGGGTSAMSAGINHFSNPDQRPNFKGTYLNDRAVKARFLEVGDNATLCSDSGLLIEGIVIGKKRTKQPNNTTIYVRDNDGAVHIFGGGTAAIPSSKK